MPVQLPSWIDIFLRADAAPQGQTPTGVQLPGLRQAETDAQRAQAAQQAGKPPTTGAYAHATSTAAQPATPPPGTAAGLLPASPSNPTAATPNPNYASTVAGSAIGQSMGDLEEFGLSPQDSQTALNWYLTQQQQQVDPAQMLMNAYQQPWFQRAFPGIIQQIKAGKPPMSPADYVAFKKGVQSFSAYAGLPQGLIGDDQIAKMVSNGMTFQDFTQRVDIAFKDSANALVNDPEAVALMDQWHGIKPGSGALAAYYIDPDRAVPLLEQETTAAQAGSAGERAGYTHLDQGTLMALAAQHTLSDITSAEQQTVGALGATRPVQGGSPDTVREQDLLAAQLGGLPGETAEQAQRRVSAAVSERTSAFHGGGGPAGGGQTGTSGVGSASQ